jgi:hypothetical protein
LDGTFNFHLVARLVRRDLELKQRADAIRLRNAVKQFNTDFPHADNVRNAVAHAGELFSSPQKIKANSQKENYAGVGFSSGAGGHFISALYERTYSVSNHGQIFSVTLDTDAVTKLTRIISLVDDAFQRVHLGGLQLP